MPPNIHFSSPSNSAALARGVFFLAFWLILTGFVLADLPAGLVAAASATWASLKLLPPEEHSPHPARLAQLMLRFLHQSVVAGIDAAWRALHPRLPLQPGFTSYRSMCPTEHLKSGFCTMASLRPGLLPAGFDADGNIAVHCLDVTRPVAQQLAEEERRFLHAVRREPEDA
jgi:multicomponent Na+:H+ antiporter subunit E